MTAMQLFFAELVLGLNSKKLQKLGGKLIGSDYAPIYLSNLFSLLSALTASICISSFGSVLVFGQLTGLLAISSFINSMFGVRTNEATVHFVRSANHHTEEYLPSLPVLYGFIIDVSIALLFALVFVSLSPLIASMLSIEHVGDFDLGGFALYACLNILCGTPMGLLYAEKKFALFAKIICASEVLFLALLLFYFYFSNEINLIDIILIYTVTCAVKLIFLILFSSFINHLIAKIFLSKQFFKIYFLYALKNFSSTFLKSFNGRIDEILLAALAGAESLGVYGLIKKGISPIYFIAQPLSASVQAEFLDLYKLEPTRVKYRVREVNRLIYLLTLLAMPLFLFAVLYYLSFLGVNIVSEVVFVSIFIGLTAVLINGLWWSRSFSNAVNPIYSVKANGYLAILNLVFMPTLAIYYSALGVSAVVLIGAVFCTYYYLGILNREAG